MYIVYDCLCSEEIGRYKSKYWAERRRQKEIKRRNLLHNDIVILTTFE